VEIAFDPVRTRWARLHARRDGSAIDAETSANGLDWNVFASAMVAPPPMVAVDLVGGVFAPEAAPAPIRFASLNTCP